MTNYLFISSIKINDTVTFSEPRCFLNRRRWSATSAQGVRARDELRASINSLRRCWVVLRVASASPSSSRSLARTPVRNGQFMVINWPDGPIRRDFRWQSYWPKRHNSIAHAHCTGHRRTRDRIGGKHGLCGKCENDCCVAPTKTINKNRESTSYFCFFLSAISCRSFSAMQSISKQ